MPVNIPAFAGTHCTYPWKGEHQTGSPKRLVTYLSIYRWSPSKY